MIPFSFLNIVIPGLNRNPVFFNKTLQDAGFPFPDYYLRGTSFTGMTALKNVYR
jgi:hypothetical protein